MTINFSVKWIAGIVVALVIGFLGAKLITPSTGAINNGAEVHNYPYWFTNNTRGTAPVVFAGYNQQWYVTDGGTEVNTGSFQLGASGTAQSNQVNNTCSMILNVSITASSTGYGYCTGVTGITSADNITAMFSTSTAAWRSYLDNIEVISAKASSTPGAIDFIVYNGTGQTAAPSALNRTGSTTVIIGGH